MRLVNVSYNVDIEFAENCTEIISIEGPNIYTEFIQELISQLDGEAGNFVLSEKNDTLKMDKKVEFISNPFGVDFNEKRIISKAYNVLKDSAEGLDELREKINSSIVNILDEVILRSPYDNFVYNLDLDWNTLFKLYDVKVQFEEGKLVDKLIQYIKMLAELLGIRVVFLLNMSTFLTKYELQELCKSAQYEKVNLVLLEQRELELTDVKSRSHIIDCDRCLIIK